MGRRRKDEERAAVPPGAAPPFRPPRPRESDRPTVILAPGSGVGPIRCYRARVLPSIHLLLALLGAAPAHAGGPTRLEYAWQPGDAAVVSVHLTEGFAGGEPKEIDATLDLLVAAAGDDQRVAVVGRDDAWRLPEEWRGGLLLVHPDGQAAPAPPPPPGFDAAELEAFGGPADRAVRRLWGAWVEGWAGTDWSKGDAHGSAAVLAAPALGWRPVLTHLRTAFLGTDRCGGRGTPRCATLTLETEPDAAEARASLESLRQRSPEVAATAGTVVSARVTEHWRLTTEVATLRPWSIELVRTVAVVLPDGQATRTTTVSWAFAWADRDTSRPEPTP